MNTVELVAILLCVFCQGELYQSINSNLQKRSGKQTLKLEK